MARQLGSVIAMMAGVALMTLACWTFAHTTPGPGERALSAERVWAVRAGGVAIAGLAQLAVVGLALPLMYRPRPAYAAGAFALAVVVALAGAGAVALLLATTR